MGSTSGIGAGGSPYYSSYLQGNNGNGPGNAMPTQAGATGNYGAPLQSSVVDTYAGSSLMGNVADPNAGMLSGTGNAPVGKSDNGKSDNYVNSIAAGGSAYGGGAYGGGSASGPPKKDGKYFSNNNFGFQNNKEALEVLDLYPNRAEWDNIDGRDGKASKEGLRTIADNRTGQYNEKLVRAARYVLNNSTLWRALEGNDGDDVVQLYRWSNMSGNEGDGASAWVTGDNLKSTLRDDPNLNNY